MNDKVQERTVIADDPLDRTGRLKALGGSASDAWNSFIANSTVRTLWLKHAEDTDRLMSATVAGLIGINPKDELEGMLAAQLLATHFAAMECHRRAMIPEQSFEGRRENLNQANKLSRTYSTLLEALNKHRGKGAQKIIIERVNVHEGGQAIVGNVTPGGGVHIKTEEQSHELTSLAAPDGAALPSTFEALKAKVPEPRDEG